MRARRKLIAALVVALAILASALVWLLRSAPPPVKLSLVCFKDEGTTGPVAIIHFTNYSGSTFRWNLHTFVLSEGVWLPAPRQPVIEHSAATLRERGSWNHSVPVPDGQNKWKVELSCKRADSRLEDTVESVFRLAKLGSPFPDSRRREIITVLNFE
jgi:hypothetical protein